MRTNIILTVAFLAFLVNLQAQIKLNPVATEKASTVTAPAPKTIAFRLSDATLGSLPASGSVVLNTSLKEFDLANNANGTQFKAPEAGVYHFDVNLTISPNINDHKNYLRYHLSLMKGDAVAENFTLMNPQTPYTTSHSLRISTTIMLNKGEVVTTKYSADAEPGTQPVRVVSASFSGFKVAGMQAGAQDGVIR